MKLCKDCVYYSSNDPCSAPGNKTKANLVTGKQSHHWHNYDVHRDSLPIFDVLIHTCGKRGRWFKQIETY